MPIFCALYIPPLTFTRKYKTGGVFLKRYIIHTPAPSSLEVISKHADFADGVAFIVSVDAPDRVVRINISVNDSDLKAIDAAAAAAGMKRSAYLVKSGLEYAGV